MCSSWVVVPGHAGLGDDDGPGGVADAVVDRDGEALVATGGRSQSSRKSLSACQVSSPPIDAQVDRAAAAGSAPGGGAARQRARAQRRASAGEDACAARLMARTPRPGCRVDRRRCRRRRSATGTGVGAGAYSTAPLCGAVRAPARRLGRRCCGSAGGFGPAPVRLGRGRGFVVDPALAPLGARSPGRSVRSMAGAFAWSGRAPAAPAPRRRHAGGRAARGADADRGTFASAAIPAPRAPPDAATWESAESEPRRRRRSEPPARRARRGRGRAASGRAAGSAPAPPRPAGRRPVGAQGRAAAGAGAQVLAQRRRLRGAGFAVAEGGEQRPQLLAAAAVLAARRAGCGTAPAPRPGSG